MMELEDLPRIVETLTGRAPVHLRRIQGGRNNLVARADLGDGPVLVKAYFRARSDRRDRLGAEYTLLSHLWRHGERAVPEPRAADPEHGVAVYEFVEGERVAPGSVGEDDVASLAGLLGRMWELRDAPGAEAIGPASDATLRAKDLVARLFERRHALLALPAEDETDRRAQAFLSGPFSDALVPLCEHVLASSGDAPLPPAERTLSPSDHGFHNALREPGRGLRFVDFEYGGFDDPAKMLADACLQPAVPIPRGLRSAFVADMLERLGSPPGLASRLRRLYPLWALQWCLIALNEFHPAARERRHHAGDRGADRRSAQLGKAETMLDTLRTELSSRLAFLPPAG